MSKRVSNKKGPARKVPARSRVRWGWRRKLKAHIERVRKHAEMMATQGL